MNASVVQISFFFPFKDFFSCDQHYFEVCFKCMWKIGRYYQNLVNNYSLSLLFSFFAVENYYLDLNHVKCPSKVSNLSYPLSNVSHCYHHFSIIMCHLLFCFDDLKNTFFSVWRGKQERITPFVLPSHSPFFLLMFIPLMSLIAHI